MSELNKAATILAITFYEFQRAAGNFLVHRSRKDTGEALIAECQDRLQIRVPADTTAFDCLGHGQTRAILTGHRGANYPSGKQDFHAAKFILENGGDKSRIGDPSATNLRGRVGWMPRAAVIGGHTACQTADELARLADGFLQKTKTPLRNIRSGD